MQKSRLSYCLLTSQGKFSEASPEADCKGGCVLNSYFLVSCTGHALDGTLFLVKS